jgi:hypothetical protein
VALTPLAIVPAAAEPRPASWGPIAREIVAAGTLAVLIDADGADGLPQALRAAGYEGEIAVIGPVDPLALAPQVVEPEADPLAPVTPEPTDQEEPPTPTPEAEVIEPDVLDGLVVVSPGVDLASRGAGWHQVVSDAEAVGTPVDAVGLGFVQGYAAADLFVRSLAATAEPLTPARWYGTVNGGWWYPGLPELVCGSWWPSGHLIGVPCVSVARVDLATESLVPLLGLRETSPQLEFVLD